MQSTPSPLRLEVLHHIPNGFLDVDAARLHEVMQQPTLVHLAGRRSQPLFVCALLHGNEDVGLTALQRVLRHYKDYPLPRSLSFFIGNVHAARLGLRRRDHEPDYNRVWPGTTLAHTPEAQIMRQVTEDMAARGVFASIDLHNNTGLNPHYACVNSVEPQFLQLANLFSRTVVYFKYTKGVQSSAFSNFCPSVICECGKTGDIAGGERAAEFVDACLHIDALPNHTIREGDLHLFHTVATVKVDHQHTMSFDGADADLMFVPDLDHFNFRELASGTKLATYRNGASLQAFDDNGKDVTALVFAKVADAMQLARNFMPAMLTRDERAVRQDCLCYLMERWPLPQ